MPLLLVSDYIADARVLLQDKVSPYRYPDADLVEALNMAMLEAARVRPDMFLSLKYQAPLPLRGTALSTLSPPVYTPTNEAQTVVWPSEYKMALLYYIVGQAQLRDTEDTQDARASAFIERFISQLLKLP